jgi:outer membrane cobalamin receptor
MNKHFQVRDFGGDNRMSLLHRLESVNAGSGHSASVYQNSLKSVLKTGVCAFALSVGVSQTASAQEGEVSTTPGAGEALEEVVITGSRIQRRDLTAPSPIVTVEQEQFERVSTVGVESMLNQLPQFQPAGTQFDTGDVQAAANNTPGISTVNLRGLGTNRNLVLINGRRAQPANASLTVDVNTIPAGLIENVEIITGGASAGEGISESTASSKGVAPRPAVPAHRNTGM